MIYCQKCGAQNDDNAQFCVGCGTPFAQPQKNDVVSKQPGKGLAIASMVCGIVSFFWAGIVLGILALIFGGISTIVYCVVRYLCDKRNAIVRKRDVLVIIDFPRCFFKSNCAGEDASIV